MFLQGMSFNVWVIYQNSYLRSISKLMRDAMPMRDAYVRHNASFEMPDISEKRAGGGDRSKIVCHHSAHDDLFVRARGRRLASTDERSRIYKTARQITVLITARRTSKALHYDQYLLLPPTSCSPSNPRGFHPRCCRTTRFPQQCEPSSST